MGPCDDNHTRLAGVGDIGRAYEMLRHFGGTGADAAATITDAVEDLVRTAWTSSKTYIHVDKNHKTWFTSDRDANSTLSKTDIRAIVASALKGSTFSVFGIVITQVLGVPMGGVLSQALMKVVFRMEEARRRVPVPRGLRRRFADDVVGICDLPRNMNFTPDGTPVPNGAHGGINYTQYFQRWVNPYRAPLELKGADPYSCDVGCELWMRYLDVTIIISHGAVRLRYATYGEQDYHAHRRARPPRTLGWMHKGAKNAAVGLLRRCADATLAVADFVTDSASSLRLLRTAGHSNTTLRHACYRVVHERWGMDTEAGQLIRSAVRRCLSSSAAPSRSCLRGTYTPPSWHPPLLWPIGPAAPSPTTPDTAQPVALCHPLAHRRVRFRV